MALMILLFPMLDWMEVSIRLSEKPVLKVARR